MVTRTRRLLGLPLIAALIATVLVAPQAHAATVTTWAQLRDAFAAGGSITVGADISGGGITASQSTPVTLDLNGHNVTLTGGPALQIEGNANVTLRDSDGRGSLTAIGTERTAAAIGSVAGGTSSDVTAGALTIDGSDVIAQMDVEVSFSYPQDAATVGGGRGVDGLTLTIQAGSLTVTASEFPWGAAIGGGRNGDSGSITINGGVVTATAGNRQDLITYGAGAAIGGGRSGSADISINNGVVTADVATGGAAIGGGSVADGGTITIKGGEVTAVNGGKGAGIGGGWGGSGGTIRLEGGKVTATGGTYGAAIGGGDSTDGRDGNGGDITITGGVINAQSGRTGASIGGGNYGDGGTITVEGGDVTATTWGDGASIGGGYRGKGADVAISGGTVTVHNTGDGAGIGGGQNGFGGAVDISGGKLDLTAFRDASTIGAGTFYSTETPPTNTELGTLRIAGTAFGSSANAVAGKYTSPLEVISPASPISFLIENSGSNRSRTEIDFGHSVSFDAKGGTPHPTAQFVAIDDKATVPTAPARTGHTFTGWFNGGQKYDFNSSVATTLTLVAGWDAHTYDVKFDSDGGSNVADQSVKHGSTVSQPKAPTRTGYNFTGWFNGSAKYDFNTAVTGPVTLKAGWDLNSYDVTFNSDGGSAVGAQSVKYGSTASAPKAPTRKGYIFSGWYAGNTKYNFGSAVTGDMTLTARWQATPAGPGPKPGVSVNLVDVSSNSSSKHYTQFHREISWLASTGITKGWNVGGGKYEFRAKEPITREAMAAFMYRYAGSPKVVLPGRSPFKDVTPSNTNFYKEIIWMSQQGISTGWNVGDGTKEFRPKDNITRDAMAAFMYRFAGKPATTPPAKSPFTDVSTSSQFYREVTWLANTGISKGWNVGGGKYEYRPYDQISREAMAAFLYRFNQL